MSTPLPDEILPLLQRYQDQALEAMEATALAAWLQADPVHLMAAREWIAFEQLLGQVHRAPEVIARRARELALRRRESRRYHQVDRIMRRGPQARRRQRRHAWAQAWAPLAIAALLVGAIALWLTVPTGPTDPDTAPTVAATAIHPRWLPDGDTPRDLIAPLALGGDQAGTLILHDGSRLRLRGPARFAALASPRHGVMLDAGHVAVVAATQSPDLPLEVVTPHGRITVLGTRFTITVAGDQSWVGVATGRVQVSGGGESLELTAAEAASLRAGGPPQRVIAADALRAAWSFEDDGHLALDARGDTPLLQRGAVTGGSGLHGRALRCLGEGDAEAERAPAALRGQAFTIAAWLRWDPIAARAAVRNANDTGGWILSQGDNYGLVIDRKNGSDDVFLYVHRGGNDWPGLSSGDVNVTDGTWHHVAGSFEAAGRMRIWFDGRLVAEQPAPGPIPYVLAEGITVGSMQGRRHFTGLLDEVRCYDRALSQGEIEALAAGAP